MIRRSLLIASCVAALSFVGSSAQAAFSITTTSTTSAANLAIASSLGLTFSPQNIVNGPTPTPASGIGFNFLNMNFSGASNFTGTGSFTLTGTFATNNNGVAGLSTYTQTVAYNFTAGSGSLTASPTGTIVPAMIGGITFTGVQFTTPTLVAGSASAGNLSTLVTAAAVPEPASAIMLGLGLAGVGFVAKRRRIG